MGRNVDLTPKQERVIEELLQGKADVDVAESCGVSVQTISRWQKDTAFQKVYNDRRQQLLNHSITALQLKFDNAVQTLDRHTKSPKTIPRDQIRASEIIVDKTLQTARLIERITELESLLAEQQQDQMYKVIFDLRQLTRAERETLEAIENARAARETIE